MHSYPPGRIRPNSKRWVAVAVVALSLAASFLLFIFLLHSPFFFFTMPSASFLFFTLLPKLPPSILPCVSVCTSGGGSASTSTGCFPTFGAPPEALSFGLSLREAKSGAPRALTASCSLCRAAMSSISAAAVRSPPGDVTSSPSEVAEAAPLEAVTVLRENKVALSILPSQVAVAAPVGAAATRVSSCGSFSSASLLVPFGSIASVVMEDMHQRLPSLIFLASNILMFSTPSKALAETCQAESSVFNMPVLLAVALIGATVGGLLARQRRGELQRVNEQLLQINAALRKQAKIESYAPSLSYAPIGGRIPDSEVIIDTKKQDLISKLKNGKNFLRNQLPDKAFMEFKNALELAQNLKDPIEEKKAARGLGASLQRQGKYRDAIKYHSMVLAISEREGEDSGNTEAFGAIADCYTELGDLERAGQFYDKYIARLEKD